jgi:glycosyltransferase involved in cell wall biosynthesis
MAETAKSISVAIISHNYGKYLANAIQSVLGQSMLPDEIIVVDDSSSDETEYIASLFRNRGVRYYRVEFCSPLLSRRFALENTVGNYLCFIDADDYIDSLYIENGIAKFDLNSNIGVVYSDMRHFGLHSKITNYPESSLVEDLSIENFIHAGSIARRDAIEVSKAFYHSGHSDRHEDWASWRKLIDMGFAGVKQESLYHYRKHENGLSNTRNTLLKNYSYYTSASLEEEEITLFTPLAGRMEVWDEYKTFLENQTRNHKKIHLVLLDSSNNPEYSRMVKKWLLSCDYGSFQYLPFRTDHKNLADEPRVDQNGYPRHDILREVRLVMPRIYNRIRNLISTNYLWIIEDDVIPPLDVCTRLLESFCSQTVSVSAPFLHRYEDSYVAWTKDDQPLTGGDGVEVIGGNGFGCVLMRTHAFKNHVFTCTEEYPDFDKGFYAQIDHDKYLVKIDWNQICQHLTPRYVDLKLVETQSTQISEDKFDALFYLNSNPDVYKAVQLGQIESAYSHYINYGFSEKRPARLIQEIKPDDRGHSLIENKKTGAGRELKTSDLIFKDTPDDDNYTESRKCPNPLELLTKYI